MNEKDDILLEYLRDIYPSAEPPKVIHWNVNNRGEEFRLDQRQGSMWSKNTTHNRLAKLVDQQLVEVTDTASGYYVISENGFGYLDEEVDASELGSDSDDS